MKDLTQTEKRRIVTDNSKLRELYLAELDKQGVKWSAKGCKINGKKAGRQKFDLAQKRIAASIYDNNFKKVS